MEKRESSQSPSLVPFVLLILVVIIAGAYYMTNKHKLTYFPFDSSELTQLDALKESNGPKDESDETVEKGIEVSDAGTLEIGVPDNVFLLVTDQDDKSTGRTSLEEIRNDIPYSDYTVDSQEIKSKGQPVENDDIHWVTLEASEQQNYRVSVSGMLPGDAIILYGTSKKGFVTSDVLDQNSFAGSGTTFFIQFDPESHTESIVYQ